MVTFQYLLAGWQIEVLMRRDVSIDSRPRTTHSHVLDEPNSFTSLQEFCTLNALNDLIRDFSELT